MNAYKWQEVYNSAVLETDWTKIGDRIQSAEAVLNHRSQELSTQNGNSSEEFRAIANCLDKLKVLRDEVASWRSSITR